MLALMFAGHDDDDDDDNIRSFLACPPKTKRPEVAIDPRDLRSQMEKSDSPIGLSWLLHCSEMVLRTTIHRRFVSLGVDALGRLRTTQSDTDKCRDAILVDENSESDTAPFWPDIRGARSLPANHGSRFSLNFSNYPPIVFASRSIATSNTGFDRRSLLRIK